MANTINQFLSIYLDGLRHQQPELLADCHQVPVIVSNHRDQRVLSDRFQVIEYCQQMIRHHSDQQLRAERFVVRSSLMLGDEFAIANVAWIMLAPNRGMKTHHTAYNVRRKTGEWFIWAVTEHEEADG